jgi:hypothetical protein
MARRSRKRIAFDPLNLAVNRKETLDPDVIAAMQYVNGIQEQLWKKNHPNGRMNDDEYFVFNEGLILRPEVIVALVLRHAAGQ